MGVLSILPLLRIADYLLQIIGFFIGVVFYRVIKWGQTGFMVKTLQIRGWLVEAAGIEPASVSPTLTGDYMLSLSL